MSIGRNTILNIAGAVIPMVVGIIVMPLLISGLGIERFGILTILWAIIGYFSLFDFGVGRATTQQISLRLGTGHHDEIGDVIRSGLKISLITGIGGVLLLASLSYSIGYRFLNVSPEYMEECYQALLITAIGIPFATMSSAYRGAIEAYEKFHQSNIAKVALGTAIFVFPAIGLGLQGASLQIVAAWLVIARLLGLVIYWNYAKQLPHYRSSSSHRTGTLYRKLLFRIGAWMTASNLVSPILVNADRVLISNLLGASYVAYYTVPFEILVRLLILPGAIGTTLLPRLSSGLPVNGQSSQAIFSYSLRITIAVMAAVCTIAAFLSYPMMRYFISDEFAGESWPIAMVLAFGVFINGVAYLPYTALHANGLARPVAILHIIELLIFIPLAIYCISGFGLLGAACVWSLRAGIDCLALFGIYTRHCRITHLASSTKCMTQG